MNQMIKIIVIAFFLSLPFWWGINYLEKNLSNQNPQIFTAQVSLEQKWHEIKPIRNKEVPDLEINATSAVSVLLDNQGKERNLFEKESEKVLPIASLTKLMTALIILDNYSMNQVVRISSEAAEKPGNGAGKLKTGDYFRVENLFKAMLVESNNSAAFALAELAGKENFVSLMNQKAKELGLENTYFINSTGLDSRNPAELNQSTARELVRLVQFIISEKPLILDTLAIQEFELFNSEGVFSHRAVNTNELLGESLVLAGKTGETPGSGGCLLLITQAPKSKGYIISVVLNSPERFKETQELLNWIKTAYYW